MSGVKFTHREGWATNGRRRIKETEKSAPGKSTGQESSPFEWRKSSGLASSVGQYPTTDDWLVGGLI